MSERSVWTERSAAGPPVPGEPLRSSDPRMIGRYEVLSRLGAGGMGAVYLAKDPSGRRVAVKVIRGELANDEEFRARFGDEVTAARRVAPFCTAEVLDADPHAHNPYLVTEFIEGKRLDTAVEESGPLGKSTLQGVAVGVASALTAIHGAGIVHRDLKPSNVMLSYSGPRVIDFGIARALDAVAGRTRSGIVLGSLGWMAPEQMEGSPVGPATDIFAWGLLIGYAATGVHPYGEGSFYEISERVLTGSPDLSGIPADLRPVVAATLGRDPRLRPSAEQILLTLLGETGRGNVRAAATRVIDGTWPGVRQGGGALDPTRLGGPTAAPGHHGGGAGHGGGEAAYRGGQGSRQAGGYGNDYRGDRPAQGADAGYDAGYGRSAGYQGGAAGRAGQDAGRRQRGGGYIRFEEPAPAPAPRRAAGRDQASYRPPYQPAPPAAARPAPPPPPPPPAPAPRPERAPRARRRRRFRIPFKKTILFVLMVLLLLSAADQIASAVNEKREALWNRLVDRVEQQIDEWRGQAGDAVNDVPGQLTDEIGDRINDRPATGGPGPGQAP
ncbi:serine/threonine-protein kinase [Frankia nepalensis]|uniref:serine/threonine-protein kinase n=2 Tax=Frankia nepalensis TaxID=1836974 RepID=UPI0038995EF0